MTLLPTKSRVKVLAAIHCGERGVESQHKKDGNQVSKDATRRFQDPSVVSGARAVSLIGRFGVTGQGPGIYHAVIDR